MRKYGHIGEVHFANCGYDIYNLAIKFKLSHNGRNVSVYANNMAELTKEVTSFLQEARNEQN